MKKINIGSAIGNKIPFGGIPMPATPSCSDHVADASFRSLESITRTLQAAREKQLVRPDVYVAQMEFMLAELLKADRTIMELRRKQGERNGLV